MILIELTGIAIGLAIDAMSVAIATSLILGRPNFGQVFRFAFFFGLFQAGMPVIGWFAGQSIESLIRTWDHWLAFTLLAAIGVKAIYEALKGDENGMMSGDPTRGLPLLVLSVATSIDAFAVGLNFGILEVNIWFPALIIGVITAALTTAGMLFGKLITSKARHVMQIFGGLVLIAIGVKILIEHLVE